LTARQAGHSTAAVSEERIRRSWDDNAGRWADAVRGGSIRSRAVATDAAIVAALAELDPSSVLDLGCGEGWLVRRLKEELGCRAAGVDGSAELIRLAREADPGGDYRVVDYGGIEADPGLLGAAVDTLIANFALLAEELSPLLRSLRAVAETLVIQTVHPWSACGDAPYVDGWREESFASFGPDGWTPMPWYFRTLASWHRDLKTAGWRVDELREPFDPASGRPFSLLLTCRPQ
jgi:SAM-dependent methyltransferase